MQLHRITEADLTSSLTPLVSEYAQRKRNVRPNLRPVEGDEKDNPVSWHAQDGLLLARYEKHLNGLVKGNNLAETTRKGYLFVAQMWCSYARARGLGPLPTTSEDEVQEWLEGLADGSTSPSGRAYRPASLKSRFLALQALFKWLEVRIMDDEEGYKNPMRRLTRPVVSDDSDKDIVPEAGMSRMFAMLEKQKRWRDRMIIGILYDTGMRESQLSGLLTEKVDLISGTIQLEGWRMGSKRHPTRLVPISEVTVECIERYLRSFRGKEPEYLVQSQRKGRDSMSAGGIMQTVRKCFDQIGIPHITPHDLRHTIATHLSDPEDGSEPLPPSYVQHLLGHASADTTDIYRRKRLNSAMVRGLKRNGFGSDRLR